MSSIILEFLRVSQKSWLWTSDLFLKYVHVDPKNFNIFHIWFLLRKSKLVSRVSLMKTILLISHSDFSFNSWIVCCNCSASIPGHEVWVSLFKITIFLYTKLLVTFLATLIDFLTENNLLKHNFLYFPLE